jgi:hypothetical protein
VRAAGLGAEVEDFGSVDLAGFGEGFAAAEVEVDEVHGWIRQGLASGAQRYRGGGREHAARLHLE